MDSPNTVNREHGLNYNNLISSARKLPLADVEQRHVSGSLELFKKADRVTISNIEGTKVLKTRFGRDCGVVYPSTAATAAE